MSGQHTLKPADGSRRPRRRLGRGDGSNRGSYSGRGNKGQKQHGKVPFLFEGGQLRIVKRLPNMRGFTNRFRVEYTPLNVSSLEIFDDGTDIAVEDLYASRLVRRRGALVKLLGNGDISKSINITVHASSPSAKAKIEAAGGTVNIIGDPSDDAEPTDEAEIDSTEAAASSDESTEAAD